MVTQEFEYMEDFTVRGAEGEIMCRDQGRSYLTCGRKKDRTELLGVK